MTSEPHWERGRRVHGYWIGMNRIGWVGLPQGKIGNQGYGWAFCSPATGVFIEGREPTLRLAKKEVEAAHKRFVK